MLAALDVLLAHMIANRYVLFGTLLPGITSTKVPILHVLAALDVLLAHMIANRYSIYLLYLC